MMVIIGETVCPVISELTGLKITCAECCPSYNKDRHLCDMGERPHISVPQVFSHEGLNMALEILMYHSQKWEQEKNRTTHDKITSEFTYFGLKNLVNGIDLALFTIAKGQTEKGRAELQEHLKEIGVG